MKKNIDIKKILISAFLAVAMMAGVACNKKKTDNNITITEKDATEPTSNKNGEAADTESAKNNTTEAAIDITQEITTKKAEVTTKKQESATKKEHNTEVIKETTSKNNTDTDGFVNYVDGIKRVCIDPGHQGKGNNELEPVGPGSSEKKKKVSYGTSGVSTKIPEYELNLAVSLMLRDELIKRGYEVVMTRESNNVNISNVERAQFGNNSAADIAVRIHANGSNNNSVKGALTIYPSENNPYVSYLSKDSKALSEDIIEELCKTTGANNRGALPRDNYSGSNWSKIPVTIVEMGYMSNPDEDKLMATNDYREKIVKGVADGIDKYFANVSAY